MSTEPAIITQGLTKSYGPVQALRGLDLEVGRGEIYGFLGPNGAGKTTTIRCLLDLIRPSGGAARVLGLDPRRDGLAVRARTGYLPGELRLDERLTVEGALRLLNGLRDRRAPWAEVRRLAERLELSLGTPVKNLSTGNKQKVGVVQALMHRPELLLLDEPTTGLDPLMQRTVLDMVRAARDAGATVFFSSHHLAEVQAIADRVGIIRAGRLAEVIDTRALAERAVHRVHVRLQEGAGVDLDALAGVRGVTSVEGEAEDRGTGLITLQVEGAMDALIRALASLPVETLETEQPSLEEVFMAYYETPGRD